MSSIDKNNSVMTAPEYGETGDAELPDAVQLYLTEIGRVALLTAEEERGLCERMARGRAAAQRLESEDRISPRVRVALRGDAERGHEARAHLITANLRLVVSIAKKYTGRGLSFMDLIQEGNIGLMRAVEKFDLAKGNRFTTYATWWVRQAITRALAEKNRTIRLPVYRTEWAVRIRFQTARLHEQLGRAPKTEELAAAIGKPVEWTREALQHCLSVASLNTPVGDDQSTELGELLAAPTIDAEQVAHEHEVQRDLAAALAALTERERRILCLRYGLADGRHRTLEEVGREIGMTRERARQIEAEALRRLRGYRDGYLGQHLKVMG